MISFDRRGFLVGAAVGGLLGGCNQRPERSLIVYCAHDSLFAAPILDEFAQNNDCSVFVKYDTEASKSLGFVTRLIAERNDPQCDVFWNNEVLGTAALDSENLLAELEESPRLGGERSDRWVSFGGRLRCVISSADLALDENSVNVFLDRDILNTCSIAKPMFGTTLTQYCCWAQAWGLSTLIERHRSWVRRGMRVAEGNAQVKDLVAAGVCELGFTDSDDLFVARDAGLSLRFEPVRVGGKTICIPNTAAVIRGTSRYGLARRLVDYLASAEVELRLSRSTARQIPLGGVDPVMLTDEVRALWAWAQDSIDVATLLDIRSEVLEWLRREYAS